MRIKEIVARSVLTRSKLPGSEYCINPYVGCSHACIYCYARFMRRFTGHSSEKWGTFVDVKVNAPQVLTTELSRHHKMGVALLGSVTDSYQPVEKRYQITRSIIKLLIAHKFPFSILTKSDLVVRDIDLLKQSDNCDVGLTITTLDDEVRRNFEPYSSSVTDRVKALKSLHENGIRTYVFIGPILPYLTEAQSIIAAVQEYVDSVWAETLNVRCGNWTDIETMLRDHYPDLLPDFKKSALDKGYWDQIGERLRKVTQHLQIPLTGYYRH